MSEHTPYEYIEKLASKEVVDIFFERFSPVSVGALRKTLVVMYKLLAEVLPKCKDGTRYSSAVKYCVDSGADKDSAAAMAALFFAANAMEDPTAPGDLDPVGGVLPLSEIVRDAWPFAKALRFADESTSTKTAFGIYLFLVIDDPNDPANEKKEYEGALDACRDLVSEYGRISEAAADIKKLKVKMPSSYQMGVSKVQTKIKQISASDTGTNRVRVGSDRKTGEDVLIGVRLSYQGDGLKLQGAYELTGFDEEVYNAIASLWAVGCTSFTANDVFRVMTGGGSKKVKKEQSERVVRSIDKMMFTRVTLDLTAELKHRNLKINDNRIIGGRVETQLLQATTAYLKASNGQIIQAVQLSAEPILFTYNKAVRHIASVPLRHLDTSAAISNTDQVISIKGYLLRQIEQIKRGFRDNRHLRYDSIYEESLMEKYPTEKADRKRVRDQIKAMLSVWVNQNFITGFSEYREGRTIVGVVIDVERKGKG